MEFAPMVAAVALIWKMVDFVKYLRVRDWDAVTAQLAVWGAGVAVLFLLASTDFARGVVIGDQALDALNVWSVILIGLSAGALGSVAYDFKRALDASDSAAQPSLITGRVPVTPPPTVDADSGAAGHHPAPGTPPGTTPGQRGPVIP